MTKPIFFNSSEPASKPLPPEKPKTSSWRSTLTEVLSGGIGGAVGAVAITPFMNIKLHFQKKAFGQNSVFPKTPGQLFVGSPTMAVGMFPVIAFQFLVNGALRKQLSDDGKRELSASEKLACSVGTGALSAIFVAPQELIWTQQQKMQAELEETMKSRNIPKHMMPKVSAGEVIVEIFEQHGFKGFYRGGFETAGREIISASVLTNLVAESPFLAPVIGAALSQPLDGRKTAKQVDFYSQVSFKDMFKRTAFAGLTGRVLTYFVFMNSAPFVKGFVDGLLKREE